MQASKVIIDPKLLSGDLSNQQKAKLRKERALDFIKSKPNGAVIKQSEFVPVVGIGLSGIGSFLAQLEKDGLIEREKAGPLKTAFYVLEGKPKAQWKTIEPHQHQSSVVDLAMRFYWETNSDSLHEFVEWASKQQR